MATYRDQGVIPIARERLWTFLDLHLDETILPRIHKEVLSQRVLSRTESEYVVERHIAFMGGSRRSVWKLTYLRPGSAAWEILESEGPMAVGSRLVNTYSDDPDGTMVHSTGEITILKIPRFLQPWLVRRVLNTIDAQDQRFLKDHPG